jgi:hypothetical protein
MIHKFYLTLVLLLSALLMSSCLKTKKDPLPLGEVNMGFIETLSPDARYLNLYVFTEDDFPCLNYFINYDFDNDLGNLTIDLKNIEPTDFCITGAGPATAQMNLGIYQNGTYQMNIKVANTANTGTLQVSPSHFIVTMDNPQMLTMITDTLYRIPDNLFWGYVAYDDTLHETIANSVLDSLMQIGATNVELTSGDYGYFALSEEGNITLIDQSELTYKIEFIYGYEGGDEDLQGIIQDFYIIHSNKIFILIRTSEGNLYTSNFI